MDFQTTLPSNKVPLLQNLSKLLLKRLYSGLNLNQYGVASPCRTICTVCGFVALS
ncbi:hypothetical protein NEIMUCOT_04961 [Neisseria mucosa ATCC 25996]|uniref:Uncharacterized protein n=1 Tax=Neisseria mucosa (strain ATCC 25996 / DSM 4631 / NCTC 10774 / M26) TaxID=546266 RepID=D2ZWG4_NEIM2|nr:hypothetical protein NEIMUCOT_04961 [Neisseria mucosa ATCC 25996]